MVSTVNGVSALAGFSLGYNYVLPKKNEDEVRQGHNYYFAALFQTSQFAQIGALSEKISSLFPKSITRLPVKVFANISVIAFLPVAIIFASVKHEHYETLAATCNKFLSDWKWTSKLPLRLPKTLGTKTVKICNFLAENSGNIMRVAMIVGSIALISLKSYYLGGAILAAMGYQIIDQRGWVPRKVSLLMEQYMPIIANIAAIVDGTIIIRIIAVTTLPTLISTSFNRWIHQKIDLLIHKYLNKQLPDLEHVATLEEIDKPVIVNKNLDFDQINSLLDMPDKKFEINASHCGKWLDSSSFPSNNNFIRFLELFKQVDWSSQYSLLSPRLKNDRTFIEFLKTKFPYADKAELKNNFDFYVHELTDGKEISEGQILAEWTEKQMEIFVEVLQGKRAVQGKQGDLDDAIKNYAKILPYLISMQEKNPIEFQDILIQLATDAGDYCARAVKRVAYEIFNSVLEKGTHDPIETYELRIQRSLQDLRISCTEAVYNEITKGMKIPDILSEDVHQFDVYRTMLGLGFTPFTERERNNLTLVDLFIWEQMASYRKFIYGEYLSRLDEAITEHGEVRFGLYMQNVIEANPNLSEQQKETILEKFTSNNNGEWDAKKTIKHFHRLMFYMLGVLKLDQHSLIDDF